MMRMFLFRALETSRRTKSSGSSRRRLPSADSVTHSGPITAISSRLDETARSISLVKSTPTPIPLTSRKNMPG